MPSQIGKPPRSVSLVSATAPYPADAGKKVVVAGLVDYWCTRVGASNVHYVLVAQSGTRADGFPVPVIPVRRPSTTEQLAGVAVRTVARRRHAIQESMLYAPRIRRQLARILADVDADLEIYDTVRLGQYAAELPARRDERRVVYLDDLFSRRYARMRTALRDHPEVRADALGEFRAHVPRLLRPIIEAPLVQRLLLRVEEQLVAGRERASALQFACLLVNPDEAADLAARTGTSTVYALPPLVPANGSPPRRTAGTPPQFVFLGLLTLPHNHDAVMTFLANQMPALLQLMPDAIVHVVGRGAQPELISLAARFGDQVRISGYVPDLDELLASAAAMVSPLRFGSGIKLKVLEALARGVPVISTSVGAEGIAAGPDQGVLIENNLDEHPRLMQRLTEPGRNARLSHAARAHFSANFSRQAVFRRYDEIFGF